LNWSCFRPFANTVVSGMEDNLVKKITFPRFEGPKFIFCIIWSVHSRAQMHLLCEVSFPVKAAVWQQQGKGHWKGPGWASELVAGLHKALILHLGEERQSSSCQKTPRTIVRVLGTRETDDKSSRRISHIGAKASCSKVLWDYYQKKKKKSFVWVRGKATHCGWSMKVMKTSSLPSQHGCFMFRFIKKRKKRKFLNPELRILKLWSSFQVIFLILFLVSCF